MDEFDPPGVYDRASFPAGTAQRPFVAANFIITADGSARKPGPGYRHFSGPADRRGMRRLRIHFDAILRGSRTLEINPRRDLGNPAILAALAKRGRSQPVVVAVTNRGIIDPSAAMVAGADEDNRPLICTPSPESLDPAVAAVCDVWEFPERPLNLAAVLARLRERRGVRRVLCEGGPTLLRALLEADLLDELLLTIAPRLFGDPDGLRLVGGGRVFSRNRITRLDLRSVQAVGDEVFLRYRISRTG
ncbi:MAG: dihydrofolate reductase family protein [Rhodospirillales bacterium]|nr:dihydrofolate reductase family protein [Rhodospirillales bacterium]